MKRDFTQIQNSLIKNSKLSDGAFRTYLLLLSYKFTESTRVYPSQRTLAGLRNVTVKTIQNHLAELKHNNFVFWKRKGYSTTNEYVFDIYDKHQVNDLTGENSFAKVSKKSTFKLRNSLLTNNININNTKDKNIRVENKVIEKIRQKHPFLRRKLI